MAIIVLKDRVKVSATTTGTGTFTLGAAATGYQSFAAIGNGNETYYTIALQSGSEWEVGKGTVTDTAGTFTLSRDTVFESSNAGNLVNFSAGTKDVFVTYPAERAIFEEPDGQTLIDGGPITVLGAGVTVNPTLEAELGKFVGNVDSFGQVYNLNQSDGSSASADFVVYNDATTDGFTHFTDMGINSSNYSSVDYPLFTPGSGYVFHDGDDFFIGNQTAAKDVVLFAGGVDTANEAVRIKGSDQSVELASDLSVAGTSTVTGAAEFQSTVLLSANPTIALQAATKAYVDSQVTAGLHIHDPVLVETTANLNATYAQGGTTFNITTITSGTTVTTSANHGLAVNDQIWLYSTAGNGLSTNTAYFVYSTPALNTLTLSLTYGGAQISGLTNASGLSYATRANSGVGATLTNAGTQAALTVDGVALATNDRVMVRLQTNGAENGVYVVTTVGSGATNWVLTRSTDCNKVNPADPNGVGTGDYFFTQSGTLNAGDSHVLTTEPNTMIIGYTTLTYTQFSGSVDYTGGTNISVVGQTISLTGTVAATNGGTGTATVTTGDLLYGSGTNTWSKLAAGAAYKSLVMNAGGTQVEWNAVSLNQSGAVSGVLPSSNGGTGRSTYTLGSLLYGSVSSTTMNLLPGNTSTTKTFLTQTGTGAASAAPVWGTIAAADVSGLAPSATTDTTNAANITSGTLPSARLNGSYTGITGVGTIAAGTWNGGVIAVAYGGTGQSSYAVGDLLYADTSTSLAKLADVATGNALISGGVGTAPAWGKIGLQTHISGTLQIANGGTGATDAATARSNLGAGTGNGSVTSVVAGSYLTGGTITTTGTLAVDATTTNTASKVVARDASGNFSAGTVTANLTGNVTGNVTGTAGGLSATLVATSGGTGQSSYTVGDLLYASTSTALSKLADVATGNALISGGVGTAPAWGKIGLTTHVSGTLPTANGGTNLTSFTANGVVYASSTSALATGSALTFDGTNLGVGTSSPGVKLDVNGNANVTTAASGSAGSILGYQAFSASVSGAHDPADAWQWKWALVGASGGGGTGLNTRFSLLRTVKSQLTDGETLTVDSLGNLGLGVTPSAWTSIDKAFEIGRAGNGLFSGGVDDVTVNSNAYYASGWKYGSTGFANRFNIGSGNGSFQWFTAASGTAGNAITFTQAMTLDANGRLVVGHTSAQSTGQAYPIQVKAVGGGAGGFGILNSSNVISGGLSLGSSSDNSLVITADPDNLAASSYIGMNVDGTERARITSAGGVSFGATGTAYGTSGQVLTSNGNAPPTWNTPTAAVIGLTTQVAYNNAGTMTGSANLTFNGTNLTVGGSVIHNSDESLKTNWRDLPADFIERLAAVKHGTYDRVDQELTQDGVSAQSLQPLLPNSVIKGDDGLLSVAYGNAALVSAIKLAQRVVEQEERIAKLEALVAQLTKGNAP